MSGVVKILVGDKTYEAVDNNVVGGMIVEASSTTTESGEQGAHPAGATSISVLGVAAKDAVTAANRAALVDGSGSNSVIGGWQTDATVPTATFTAYNDCWTWCNYKTGTAVGYRQPIKAAANGQVTLWVSGTDAEAARIGWCAQKGGVGTGGGMAKTRILV